MDDNNFPFLKNMSKNVSYSYIPSIFVYDRVLQALVSVIKSRKFLKLYLVRFFLDKSVRPFRAWK